MVGSLPGFFIGVGDDGGETTLLFLIFIGVIAIYGGGLVSDIPFVWGAASFIGITTAIIGAAAGTGLGLLLVPLAFAFTAKCYFPAISEYFGPGVMAFICVAFFAVITGS